MMIEDKLVRDAAQYHCAAMRIPRRRLLATLAAGLGILLLPARALAKKLALSLDSLPVLKKVGGFAIAMVKDREILLIRDTDTSVRATRPFCTHQNYRLHYDAGSRQIVCKNHGSRYDLTGKVLKGPTTQALPTYAAELDSPKSRIILKLD